MDSQCIKMFKGLGPNRAHTENRRNFDGQGFGSTQAAVVSGVAACRQLRWFVVASCLLSAGSRIVAQSNQANQPAPASESPQYSINLGDFAKGDGSDETEAIQKIFDSIHMGRPGVGVPDMGGRIYIPRPPVAYCISKTIRIVDKWNTSIVCQTPVWGSSGMPAPHYFRWIGPDGGTMFEFRNCKGMRVESLSMTGLDHKELDVKVEKNKNIPIGRHTRGVTGIRLGPENRQQGYQTSMVFDQLTIGNVAVGVKLGDYPSSGPDVRELSFRGCTIAPFSHVGIWARSGNLANVTFETLATYATNDALCGILVDGGELLVLNYTGSSDSGVKEAEILLQGGGIHVIKAWSEFEGPFLKTVGSSPEWSDGTYGSVNYPVILEGIRHYAGGWPRGMTSIIYNKPVPLHLIGCSFWGKVELGAQCMAPVIDYGTVFIDKNSPGFTGEGVTKYHRLIQVGSLHRENARIVEPYFVDRRHVPGTGPPQSGQWEKGDGIVNTDPNPDVAEKSCRGWLCVEAGEPGRWLPYGALIVR